MLSEHHSVEFILVWFAFAVNVPPQHTKVRTIFLINTYLKIHLSYVTNKCTGFRRNRISTSKRSLCSFGPVWMTSFNDTPSHCAEQSNTIRTLVVDLCIRKTGKCGRYHAQHEKQSGILRQTATYDRK